MYKEIKKGNNIYPKCKTMDKYLTSLGFTEETIKHLQNPCKKHDPHLMHGTDEATDLLLKAIKNNDRICIIGDYDADGVCSTAELYLTFKELKADVFYIIPHRIRDGYGINNNLVDKAIDNQANVIVTCDNGIAAIEPIQYAKSKGLTVIVTDHHEIQEELPPADVIVHPGLGKYPFRDISGAQVAYKLCQCLLERKSEVLGKRLVTKTLKQAEYELNEYLLQLSAITIVTDVMPIAQAQNMELNENRLWLQEGLKSLQNTPNWRIVQLLEGLKINPDVIEETTIGFYIGPVINSAGRLSKAEDAVDLLVASNKDEALQAMSFLIFLNEQRKEVKAECMSRMVYDESEPAHVIALENVHEGVIGILAGQLMNTTHKPSIVFTDCEVEENGLKVKAWKGSARAKGAVNLFETLSKIKKETGSIYAFGGHAGAAGITVLDRNFKVFKDAVLNEISNIDTDVEVNVVTITAPEEREALIESVKELKPFGQGMPLPKIKETHSISSIDLFYKKGHVKFHCWEKDKAGKWQDLSFWNFGALNDIKNNKQYMDNLQLSSSNVNTLLTRMSEDEAENNKMETYKRKKECTLRRTFIIEMGYSAFGNVLGPNPSLIDVF